MKFTPHRSLLLFTLSLLLVAVSPAQASGPMVTGGEPLAEPLPGAAQAHVIREELRIDMRPVQDEQPVRITARYVVRNDGDRAPLTLFFVAPGLGKGSVRHQGRTIPARATQKQLPGAPEDGEQSGFSFELMLEHGEQVVEMDYLTDPQALHFGLVDSYALDYSLMPALHWASYGRLTVHVELPPGFDVLETPEALVASANQLGGEFATLPSGLVAHRRPGDPHERALAPATLRLHIAPAPGPYRVLEGLRWLGCGLALLAPIAFAVGLRRRARVARVDIVARIASFLACGLLVAALPLAALPVQNTWLHHTTPQHGYLFATVVTWLLGAVLTIAVHVSAGRRAR